MDVGVIEGFYGQPWGWAARADALPFLAARGFSFFLYAPKADSHLRGRWQEPHPAAEAKEIRDFGAACRERGLEFGVGLSPLKLHESWGRSGRAALKRRLESLRALKLDILGVFFDDMKGDFPDLAKTQAEILRVVQDADAADKLLMCPTYYSEAAVLDRLFGPRPADYLEVLGRELDRGVGVFWTGQAVVSARYPAAHLEEVHQRLGRKPFLWDNYPVNDGPRMSRFLHLRAPERGPAIRARAAGLAANPMNQSWLSRIPLLCLARGLIGVSLADEAAETDAAIDELLPADAAALLRRDWRAFQERGMEGLGSAEKAELIADYRRIRHPAAAEVVAWLEGRYAVSADVLTDV